MKMRGQISALVLLVALADAHARAQQAAPGQPQTLDSVVAVIGGDVLLASDIDEEVRFSAFLPYTATAQSNTRMNAAERLIDRTLILQQERLQPGAPVTDKDVDRRIAELRNQIPACARANCATEEGWKKYLSDHGFTEEEVRERWRQRLEILAFIDERFKQGIRIGKPEIQTYYETKLVPQFEKEKVKAPPLESISPRVEEILLQQKVSSLLFDWLQTLRDQGSVHILDPTIANISSPDELNKRVPEKKPQ